MEQEVQAEIVSSEPAKSAGALDLAPAILKATELGREGVEVLERLHAIQKEERAASARAAFNAAISELHGLVGSITKNRTASFKTRQGASVEYRYADLHQVATCLRRHTKDLGLSWRWSTEYIDSSEVVTCTVSHRDGHSESSTWRAPIESGNPMTSAPQKAKIATTFAQRVTLIQAFGLTDTEDDVDGAMPNGGGGGSTAVTDDQAREIEALIDAAGMDEKATQRFLKWAGVPSVSEVPAARFGECIGLLKRKAKQANA